MRPSATIRRKLRVVTLVDGIGLAGGAERLAREIVVRLDPDRFEPTLCVSRWSRSSVRGAARSPALWPSSRTPASGFLGLRRRGTTDLLSWRPLLALLRGGIDVLHGHKIGSNVWAAVLGTLARTPAIVAHEHTWSFEGQPLRKLLDRRLIAARADAFLAVSAADRRRMIEIERIDPAQGALRPQRDPGPAAPGRRRRPARARHRPRRPIVGTVCALRPQKALDVLIEAAPRCSRRFEGDPVLIVGDGPGAAGARAPDRRARTRGTVILLGHRDDVRDLLRGFDVAVCCSDFEGTPLSVLEYMEASLPIVATRVGGVPDMLGDGSEGILSNRATPGRSRTASRGSSTTRAVRLGSGRAPGAPAHRVRHRRHGPRGRADLRGPDERPAAAEPRRRPVVGSPVRTRGEPEPCSRPRRAGLAPSRASAR